MSSAVVTTLIATAISGLGVIVSLLAQRARQRQWDDDRRRTMTERVYEHRLVAYPVAMRITDPLRRGAMSDFRGSTSDFLSTVGEELDVWQSSQAAFIMSNYTLQRIYRLRDALRLVPADPSVFAASEIERVFKAKNEFRW